MYQPAPPAAPSGMATKLGGLLPRCAVACLLAITVSVLAGTAAAGAQDSAAVGAPGKVATTDPDAAVAIDQGDIVAPEPSVPPTLVPPDPGTGADDPGSGDNDGDDGSKQPEEPKPAPPTAVTKKELARGSAATQSEPAKEHEADASCKSTPAPTSPLLAVGGSVASDPPRSWSLWALVAFLAAGAVGVAAFAIRKRASRGADNDPRTSALEIVSTIVAISAGVAALAGQFVPGVGVHDAPAPEATMQVRDVNARVTRGDFAAAVDAPQPPSPVDRREIGNVVWLAIHLQGFRGKDLVLQWGSYDVKHGKRFVPGTDKTTPVSVTEDSDEQTVFQPIWVGYPQQATFQVFFRLLDGGRVREIAKTGEMRGALYRYSCPTRA
jgi:hypothetical protein